MNTIVHVEYYESVHNMIEKKIVITFCIKYLFDQQKISNFEEKVWFYEFQWHN